MLEQAQNDFQSVVTPLLRGIAEDLRTLLRQEIALAKSETRQELARTRTIAFSFALSLILGLSGLILLSLMGVELLAHFFPELLRWQCFAFAAGMEIAAAYHFLLRGRANLRKLNLIPVKTAESLKKVMNG